MDQIPIMHVYYELVESIIHTNDKKIQQKKMLKFLNPQRHKNREHSVGKIKSETNFYEAVKSCHTWMKLP